MVVLKLFIIFTVLTFIMVMVCREGVKKMVRSNPLKYSLYKDDELIDKYSKDNVGKLFSLGLLAILTLVFGFWTIIAW